MIRNQLVLALGVTFAISATATKSELDKYEACHRSCNSQFIADELANGKLASSDSKYASEMLQEHLQETIKKISSKCTANDLLLLSDALCFSVDNHMCNRRNKFVELPPFEPNAKNVSASLIKLIAGRQLTAACLKIYPR